MNMPKTAIYAVAIVSIVCALGGYAYNASSFAFFGDDMTEEFASNMEMDAKVFQRAYILMSAASCILHTALLVTGVMLFRLRLQWVFVLIGLFAIEMLYIFGISALWLVPDIGMGVAGATGVANGGLMFKWMILFPIWGTLLSLWGRSRLRARREPPKLPDA